MKVKIQFFLTFRELFGSKTKEIELGRGSTIQVLLNLLCDSYECRQKIFDDSDKLRSNLRVLKNGRPIEFLDGVQTELKEGDVVAIFPPVAGG